MRFWFDLILEKQILGLQFVGKQQSLLQQERRARRRIFQIFRAGK
jgi:hypothetical protein